MGGLLFLFAIAVERSRAQSIAVDCTRNFSDFLERLRERREALGILLLRPDADPHVLRQPESRERAHDDLALGHGGGEGGGLLEAEHDEVRDGFDRVEAERAEPLGHLLLAGDEELAGGGDVVLVADGGDGGVLRHRVDVERLPHLVEQVDAVRLRQRVPHAQPGQPVRLGERPQRDDGLLAGLDA